MTGDLETGTTEKSACLSRCEGSQGSLPDLCFERLHRAC